MQLLGASRRCGPGLSEPRWPQAMPVKMKTSSKISSGDIRVWKLWSPDRGPALPDRGPGSNRQSKPPIRAHRRLTLVEPFCDLRAAPDHSVSRHPRATVVDPVETWWNPRGTLPQGRRGPFPEPIWAETPKLSAVGEKHWVQQKGASHCEMRVHSADRSSVRKVQMPN